MDNVTVAELQPAIQKAARVVARKWPNVADAGDIEQDIWEIVLTRPSTEEKLMEMESAERSSALERIGHQIASNERDEHAVFRGNIYYSTDDVRALLGKVSDAEDGEIGTLTDRLDLDLGMEELRNEDTRYADILAANYWLLEPVHEYRVELTRAVDRLTVLMNRVHNSRRYSNGKRFVEGPGTRKVVSNQSAASQNQQSHEYQGVRGFERYLNNG